MPRLAGKFSEPLAERCGGGPAPGAASPRSGRLKGVMGGVEGFKGEDTELPLIPPLFAAHSGQVCFPLKKKINFHPFSKGKKFFPRGSTFYGGARGRFPFFRPRRLIRRGYGAQIYDFSAPSRANALPQSAPPRPLQTSPTPSSGTLMGASRPPPRLAPPEKSGLIKARTVSPIGGIMFAALAG